MSTNDQENENENEDENQDDSSGVQAPPTTLGGILKRLGPGLIVAGSIVGSYMPQSMLMVVDVQDDAEAKHLMLSCAPLLLQL